MAELDAIYNPRFLELAAAIPHSGRLASPDATATAQSRMCGSTVTVDIVMRDGRVAAFAQQVKACLLGQAAAAIVGREVIGSSADEVRRVAGEMQRLLSDGGPAPQGRWSDLALLAPVRDYPARHASTMLVFTALEKAFTATEQHAAVGPREPAALPR